MPPPPEPLHPDRLTWATMLSRWVEFAQSTTALPEHGEEGRVKASVPDLIMLQAVWFALRQLDELDPAERALGLDRAGLLIRRHTQSLRRRWHPGQVPEQVEELIHEAEAQWAEASKG